jgi:glutathione S-transferase
MFLYGGLLSPFVMRVVLAARAKGIDLPVKLPDGGIKTPEFLKLNPMGKMPTLIHDGFALPESEVIVQYLEDVHPRPSIMPENPQERARARLLSRLADVYVMPQIAVAFQGQPVDAAAMAGALGAVEHFMAKDDTHAAGHGFSIADCTLIPILFFFDAFQAQQKTADMLTDFPKLNSYWQRAKLSETGMSALKDMSAALTAFMKARAHANNA